MSQKLQKEWFMFVNKRLDQLDNENEKLILSDEDFTASVYNIASELSSNFGLDDNTSKCVFIATIKQRGLGRSTVH